MHLLVRHVTRYRFDPPIEHGLQRLRLHPKETHGQTIRSWSMEIAGGKAECAYDDHNFNQVSLISIPPGTEELTITCTGEVETSDRVGLLGKHGGRLPLWAFRAQSPLTKPGPKMKELAAAAARDNDGGDALALLHGLSRAVVEAVDYAPGHTDVATTGEAALAAGKGVCQDHVHVFIGCARALGVPARYVSGYLMMNDRVEQEAGHAWAEAHVDGLGWVGFDIANGICPDARYVRVASGRDYAEAAPVIGINLGETESTLTVSLAVEQQAVQQ
ncbi:transglutaminase family protein [Novosphingobium flavum]|uniref:Transglutaminase family protein n=1 Tax=Novosphingobium flavum TaxID=1778672 RepID=A0A7X1FRT8_9SPHN|nr:transglutaminase family protein [Novosphingobium flavum]MBC2665664.1 transglutaminase family protein [Novosphingobium flavum]